MITLNFFKIGFCFLVGVFLLSMYGCATSAGGHEQAKKLSAQVTIVAEEGKRFVDSRDALAKARLRNMHNLENNLNELEQDNAIDQQAWQVVGAKFRIDLYKGVLAATKKAADEHQRRAQLRDHQAKELAARKSAVQFQRIKLINTAKKLSLLGKKSSRDEERARLTNFMKELLTEIEKEEVIGKLKTEEGKKLLKKVETNLEKARAVEKKLKFKLSDKETTQ